MGTELTAEQRQAAGKNARLRELAEYLRIYANRVAELDRRSPEAEAELLRLARKAGMEGKIQKRLLIAITEKVEDADRVPIQGRVGNPDNGASQGRVSRQPHRKGKRRATRKHRSAYRVDQAPSSSP